MTPVNELKGVGDETVARLAKIGIKSIEDVLFHLPLRYQDRTHICPISSLTLGSEALVVARVSSSRVIYRPRRTLIVEVVDRSGKMKLRFFYFSTVQQKSFRPDQELYVYGESRLVQGKLEMIHPEYRFTSGRPVPLAEHYQPIYPTTEGLNQRSLMKITTQALAWLAQEKNTLKELLSKDLDKRISKITLQEAINSIHRPPKGTDLAALLEGHHPAYQRLAFEELLANMLSLKRLRKQDKKRKALALRCSGKSFEKVLSQLPFELTAAQRKVIDEISHDLEKNVPMMRLVQGDVGCGKTLVAVASLLQAIECGHQAALMAPTEILAEQHALNLREIIEPLGIKICLVTGRQQARVKKDNLRHIRQGSIQLIIGTHALFQDEVKFNDLALVVIDEKHRFGVHQRLLLKEKGTSKGCEPHQLVMTATPIPRSLAMVMYADLDYSIIDEMPLGRKPIQTIAIPDRRRREVIERVRDSCKSGAQVYWVCALIEESELLQCEAAQKTFTHLETALADLKLGLVHGQLNAAEKEKVMGEFKRREIDVLVATTVIEVGVDVSNASLMIIENAERMGLAQLHQLRGRVGRGARQSACVLIYKPPLSAKASNRLRALRRTNDGFEIAREDLRLRGPGEIMGTRQKGRMYFRIADLGRDAKILQRVNEIFDDFLQNNPKTSNQLIDRWLGHLARYGEV